MADEQELQTTPDEQDTEISPVDGPNSDENTEPDQEAGNEENDAQTPSESDSEASSSDDEEEPDYDLMSDDEFTEYIASGKLPDDWNKRVSQKQSITNAKAASDDTSEPVNETTPKQSKPSKQAAAPVKQTGKATTASDGTDAPKSTGSASNVDYKAAYEAIFRPFKANGKEITPRSVNDVISLMQMGANYTKKMQLMAPMKKAAQTLINNNVNEEDLSFLIDLHRGDKEAIKELLKKNSIDITDLDLDEVKYSRSRKNIASDDDVAFQDAVQDVDASTEKIQEIFDKVWDKESKSKVLRDPRLLRALHEEIQMGRFDEVQKIVESEKTFGRYQNTPDIDVYIDVVTKLVEAQQRYAQQQRSTQQRGKSTNQKSSEPSKPSTKSKAAPTRGKQTSKGASTLTAKDIFSMSDEEFSKLNIADMV